MLLLQPHKAITITTFPPNCNPRNPRTRRTTTLTFTVRSSNANANANARSQSQTLLPKTAIQRIAEKLRALGFTDDGDGPAKSRVTESSPSSSAGEIFVPQPSRLPKHRVGHTIDTSWSTPENPVPAPGTGAAFGRFQEMKREVRRERREFTAAAREEEAAAGGRERERVPTLAELRLSGRELRRLTTEGIELRKKLKVGKAGITEGIVNGIHERWRHAEVVKIECEDICRMNMKRTHDLLEKKTGGLVVWRSGSKLVLYRGPNYVYPYFFTGGSSAKEASDTPLPDEDGIEDVKDGEKTKSGNSFIPEGVKVASQSATNGIARPSLVQGVGIQNRVRFQLPGEAQMAEEADRLLDGLGPRFTDWWGYDPQPVDADLLPPVVRGYRKPFRLLPYGVLPKLTNDEMTTLRRLARPLPCHFALGRNRNLQGLASSIVKLWEKCEVAKIAVKRGVQNTNSEIMAEELKSLTGGCLLARDREFIVLYRGKDFLPHAVSSAIEERRKLAIHVKKLRTENGTSIENGEEEVGTSNEPSGVSNTKVNHLPEQRKTNFTEESIKRTSIKLSMAIEKREKAEKLLADLDKAEMRQQPEIDKEGITAEERYMLRKIGLRMQPFLLLGRRGVFDGTVENMHLHWKYRELVKIITNEKSADTVHETARILEAESGGILVAVERVSKGYAIIVYRGKNYIRPASLRPKSLLNKKAALKRSIEAQRRESLKLHVLKLNKNIKDLQSKLVEDKEANKRQLVDQSSELVKEEADELLSTESLSFDAEVESVSPSKMTASPDEILEPAAMSSSNTVGEQSGASENNVAIESLSESNKGRRVPVMVDRGRRELPSGPLQLSNRERLLLRRQALKMRYRPVLAVGRSNIVTGVARTISTHFKKYPLAIVNVKGRAKGTSVQEVVFMLEQATGAVLVSHEPSKVILYRGWGAEESSDNHRRRKKRSTNTRREVESRPISRPVGRPAQPAVSPELLDAIRTECGLQSEDPFQ